MPSTIENDLQIISDEFCFHGEIKNASVLVTGASGLIGSIIIKSLSKLNNDFDLNLKIFAHARNRNKIETIFSDSHDVEFLYSDIQNITLDQDIDYIFHCASPTSSKFYVESPVETIDAIFNGTNRVLELSKQLNARSIVMLSSLESYGTIKDDLQSIDEKTMGLVDPISVRSSYPLAKKMSECLCHSYHKQFNVPVKIARLTQVFGAGISKDDNRVFAQFARSVVEKRSIILHTNGRSKKPYCYTTDTLSALFHILFRGESGEAYNVANPATYISIRDMAGMLSEKYPASDVIEKVMINHNYAPETKLRLDTTKLENLGWKPAVDLGEMFQRLINDIKEN